MAGLLGLTQSQPFDLIVLYFLCRDMIRQEERALFQDLKAEHGKPIIICDSMAAEAPEQDDVVFLPAPFSDHDYWEALRACLKLPAVENENWTKAPPQHRRTRPPRIVVLDNESSYRATLELILTIDYETATTVECRDGDEAWVELSRTDPDLFSTDYRHDGLQVTEILSRLAARGAKYPIIIISLGNCLEQFEHLEQVLRECPGPGLNLTFQDKFFSVEEIRRLFRISFGPPDAKNSHRPLFRAVIFDDDPLIMKALKTMIRHVHAYATVTTFTDIEEAWQELIREDPDLLTIDWQRPKSPSDRLLRLLAGRKAKYPILVISADSNTTLKSKSLNSFVAQGLDIRPFTFQQLRSLRGEEIPRQEPPPEILKEETSWRRKLLLVDDDPGTLELFKELLSALPGQPQIHTALSSPLGLEMLDAEPFDVLICGLKMPKMDGLQLLSIVRRKYPELRTVMLTAVTSKEYRSRAYELGVDLFCNKQDEPSVVLGSVASLFERA